MATDFSYLTQYQRKLKFANEYAIKNPTRNVKKNIFIVLFLCQYHKVITQMLSEFHCPAALQKAV